LSEISFRVARGETIAFVGPSGAGKTSLVKLLVGLYRPKSGHIFYNGTPEDQVAIEDLRERIGFVTQDHAAVFRIDSRELAIRAPGRHGRRMPGSLTPGRCRRSAPES